MTAIRDVPGLHIDLTRQKDGAYQISGHHLRPRNDYEYWITIRPENAACLAGALGVARSDIHETWEAQVQEIAREGECTWLKRHGVPYEFSSWGDPI